MEPKDGYLKRATDKVNAISNAAKAKVVDELGTESNPKGRIAARQKQIDDAVGAAVEMKANGGMIWGRSRPPKRG